MCILASSNPCVSWCVYTWSSVYVCWAQVKSEMFSCVFLEWYDLNQRATASTRTKLLCCTNPLLRKSIFTKVKQSRGGKCRSARQRLTRSTTPTCYESATELVKVVGGVIAQGLLNWRPSEVTLEKKRKTDLTQQAEKYFMCKCIQNMRMMASSRKLQLLLLVWTANPNADPVVFWCFVSCLVNYSWFPEDIPTDFGHFSSGCGLK